MKKMLIITCLITSFVILNGLIGWSGNIWPNSGSNHVNGNDITVYYQIYKDGVTDGTGQGADISATLYYRLQGEPTYNSVAMSYIGDVGNNDEYSADIPNTAFDSNDVVEWYCEGLDETDMSYSYGEDQNEEGAFTDTNPGTYNITAGTNQDVTVTFQVDMRMQASVTSVYLAGSFNGWDSSATQMSLVRNGIYSVDVFFSAGSNYEQTYKYVKNGTDWEYISNRELTINDANPTQILDVVYFNNESLNAVPPAIGNGSSSSPYEIATLENLTWIAADDSRWSLYYVQTANIDASSTSGWFSGAGWIPIGNNTTKFTGFYDGNDNTISDLYINRPTTGNVGLFGHIGHTSNATTIKNLRLLDVEIYGARGTGSLVGRVTGNINTLIENCYVDGGSVTGDAAVGGLVGSNNSETATFGGTNNPVIYKCWSNVSVNYSGVDATTPQIVEKFGGLVGCSQKGTIRDSYSRSSVTANKNDDWSVSNIGGLVGCVIYRGRIERAYSTGPVTGTGSLNVGGLVGNNTVQGQGNNGVIVDSFWDTQSSGQLTSAAGTGKTTIEMKDEDTFNLFWDFSGTWALESLTNDGYPYLAGQTGTPTITIYISEVSDNKPGGDSSTGYMILENKSGFAVSLNGFTVERGENPGTGFTNSTYSYLIPDGYTIPDNGIVYIGNGAGLELFNTTWGWDFIAAEYIQGNASLEFTNGHAYALTDDGSFAKALVDETPIVNEGDRIIQTSPGVWDTDAPLPVTLSHFAATFQNGVSKLVWQTQAEVNNSHWNIYRSISENVGQSIRINVNEIEGAGTTTEPTDYEYFDEIDTDFADVYFYWLESVDFGGAMELFGPLEVEINLPGSEEPPPPAEVYGLFANYPNPFNPDTVIRFALEEGGHAVISIYNVKGEKVATVFDETVNAKEEIRVHWDGTNRNGRSVASGIYFYRLDSAERSELRKMLLIK